MAFAQHGDQGQVDHLIFSDDHFLNIFPQATGDDIDHRHLEDQALVQVYQISVLPAFEEGSRVDGIIGACPPSWSWISKPPASIPRRKLSWRSGQCVLMAAVSRINGPPWLIPGAPFP